MKVKTLGAAACVATAFSFASPAAAYPIDCAILLCLAGGFPASAECSAAKAELIRRITPWPVEPPLQLWRCPMGGHNVGLPSGGGSDSIPPEVAQYRDAIELWQLSKHVTNGSGGRDVYTSTVRYGYACAHHGDPTTHSMNIRPGIPRPSDHPFQPHPTRLI